jgi:hypothetical protein
VPEESLHAHADLFVVAVDKRQQVGVRPGGAGLPGQEGGDDVLLVLVVGFAAAGTPDTCQCRSSSEPRAEVNRRPAPALTIAVDRAGPSPSEIAARLGESTLKQKAGVDGTVTAKGRRQGRDAVRALRISPIANHVSRCVR